MVPLNTFLLYFPILVVLVQIVYFDIQGDDTLVPRTQPGLGVTDLIIDVVSTEETVVLAHGVADCPPLPVCCLESVPTLEIWRERTLHWRRWQTSQAAPTRQAPPPDQRSATALGVTLSENLRDKKPSLNSAKGILTTFINTNTKYHNSQSTTQFGKNINPTAYFKIKAILISKSSSSRFNFDG